MIIIGSLLYFEFSGTVRIQDSLHNMQLTAVLPARIGGQNGTVQSVSLNVDGLIFTFDRQIPLEIRTASGTSLFAAVSGYNITPGSIEISFGESLQMLFFSNGSAKKRIEVISTYDEPLELQIPFSHAASVQIEPMANVPFVSIYDIGKDEADPIGVAFPSSTIIDTNQSSITLKSLNGSFPGVFLSRVGRSEADRMQYWISSQYDFPHVDEYSRRIAEYIDSAYEGWTKDRYNGRSGTWRMPDSSTGFDEKIVTATFAESLKRGTYQQIQTLYQNAITLYQDQTTWLSTPFLGDIVNKMGAIEQRDLDQIQRISDLISDNRTEVFAVPKLIELAVDRAPYAVIQGLADLASRIDYTRITLSDAVGMLATYADSLSMDFEYSEAFIGLRSVVDELIIPALTLTEHGLLPQSDNRVDVHSGIKAGKLLVQLGKIESDQALASIGKEIVSSLLAFQDDDGYLPSSVTLSGPRVTGTAGTIKPEDMYNLLTDSVFYPRHVSLSSELGRGTWMWTMGENISVEQTGANVRLSFSASIGSTHHFVVRGIRPFTAIRMFDIPWKSDPRFQYYTSGWLYDTQSATLYVKITHRSDTETILITY